MEDEEEEEAEEGEEEEEEKEERAEGSVGPSASVPPAYPLTLVLLLSGFV